MRILLICITSIIFMGMSLSGCTIYKIEIQQGNVLEQDTVEKLKIGMTKQQVQFVMGSAILKDPFHPDRWDYVHTLRDSVGNTSRRVVTIFFVEDKLIKINDSDEIYLKVDEPESTPKSDS